MRRTVVILALFAALALHDASAHTYTPQPAVVEVVQAEHAYTTSYLWCRYFTPGVYYLSETFTRWQDNWWGSGHYAAYSWTVHYSGRCYPA